VNNLAEKMVHLHHVSGLGETLRALAGANDLENGAAHLRWNLVKPQPESVHVDFGVAPGPPFVCIRRMTERGALFG